jgi:hypothetical protein
VVNEPRLFFVFGVERYVMSVAVTEPASRHRPLWLTWAFVLLAVAPYSIHYYYHYQSPRGPTGLIHNDFPQYSAYGREIFERGNGLAYPNAYDTDPHPPIIYFHWYIWILGFGVKILHFDPGLWYVATGVVSTLLFGYLTFRVVEVRLDRPDFTVLLSFAALWGGGLFCLARALVNTYEGRWWRMDLLLYEPPWIFNWGKNAVPSVEALYHAIVLWCWLSIFQRRWWTAIFATLLLATTHPFSGLQLTGAVSAWWTFRLLQQRDRATLFQWLACVAISAGFLGYNLVFLNRFPQHRAVHDILTLPHIMTVQTTLLAYTPVAVIAALRVIRDRHRLTHKDGFLFAMLGVTLALVYHDRYLPIKPIEPMHFTRGYVWMSLFLLGLPLMQEVLVKWRERLLALVQGFHLGGRVRQWAAGGLLAAGLLPILVLGAFDNLSFNFLLFEPDRISEVERGCFLSREARAALAWIDQQGLDGILLCPGHGTHPRTPHRMTSYLSASYTSVRPHVGHHFMTPGIRERVEQVEDWTNGVGEHPWFAQIDYILTPRNLSLPLLKRDEWESIYENDELVLLRRKAGVMKDASPRGQDGGPSRGGP